MRIYYYLSYISPIYIYIHMYVCYKLYNIIYIINIYKFIFHIDHNNMQILILSACDNFSKRRGGDINETKRLN